MAEKNTHIRLHSVAQLALFITSYIPLFLLLIYRQLYDNWEKFNWGGINKQSISVFISNFGLSAILIVVSVLGLIGFRETMKNIRKDAPNGSIIRVVDVDNKNSESIGYIATYIIPFLFQKMDSLYELVSILFLLVIIYRIYINSTLILINPIISLWYSIYQISFEEAGKTKNGLIISEDKYLSEGEMIKIYPIGHKLYFSLKTRFKS